jgi:beta-1,4-mannosyl-glycoprotein beta-1,4-N-acetylglucosaminyltransferase
MELIVTEKEKGTICLNMIVKDESHIIKNTLEMLCTKFHFDYWVICDTGSTDGTQDIITKFFNTKGIPGELFNDVWTDFAVNRTLALNRAFGKTDLLLIFDADDEIHGHIQIPSLESNKVLYDEYHMKFGSPLGTSYTRVLLINNKKRFQYLSVLHEFISCLEPNVTSTILEGDYYVVSGRSGNRSKDPNKYLKDALILEKAHGDALKTNDPLYHRYAFYCANSYKDCGKHEEAIKWYKITLKQDNWDQEKYVSCLYIYDCYVLIGQQEHGFFYLIEAFSYDIERVECLYPLLVHYCCANKNQIAYNYYLIVRDFYENYFINTNMDKKLFINVDKCNFFVPYYMILVADKIQNQDFGCVLKMFVIIFTKQQKHIEIWYIKNLLYNLQFFIQHVKQSEYNRFIEIANNYISFLKTNGVPLETFDFLQEYKKYGINTAIFIEEKVIERTCCKFSKAECASSKNILFFVGFSDIHWNYSYLKQNALGGSEKAVAYLTKHLADNFSKDSLSKDSSNFSLYIVGDVLNEEFPGVNLCKSKTPTKSDDLSDKGNSYHALEQCEGVNLKYIHLSHLPNLINEIPFHTVICSRYISFLEMYKTCSFHQFYIWAHDTSLLPYGSNLSDNAILEKWSNYIDGCVCQTKWHSNEYINRYPSLKGKVKIINNGIDTSLFSLSKSQSLSKSEQNIKQLNKFIYTSRTERGLTRLLELWPQILLVIPDAELVISTYTKFPLNNKEEQIKTIIEKYDSIRHLGQLNTEQLYYEMSTSEYWLYPTSWPETSCITALEMLMSEVICLYYPVAGLTDTMDKYGIQIQKGNEVETLINLTTKLKNELKKNGRIYAESCSWAKKAEQWTKILLTEEKICFTNLTEEKTLLTEEKEKILFFVPFWYNILNIQDYFDSYKSKCNVIYTSDPVHALTVTNATKLIFVFEVSNEDVYNHFLNLQSQSQLEISILNTEPLNLVHRFQNLKIYLAKYCNITIYDYSLSNIKILNDNGYTNTHHLPYVIYKEEQDLLEMLNKTTEKIYDFGIISAENPVIVERRLNVVNFLTNNGYSVKVIQGFKGLRDNQIATCKTLLNIHGSNSGEDAKIFEHIRCDRLLAAGYHILSEDCYHLDTEFLNKYIDNLTIIRYQDFFKKDTYLNLTNSITKNTKIVDCFIFYNELEMLTYRLNLLYEIVDYFVIVEARQTFVGSNKPLYFEENKHLFTKFFNKIIHIIVDLPFTKDMINILQGDQWTNEKFQRNCISKGLQQIDQYLCLDDVVIIADLDEIPDPTMLTKIKNNELILNNGISRFEQDFYYYNLNSKRDEKWYHCKILTVKKYNELGMSCESIRFLNCDTIVKGGWHLSYFGDASFIKNKLENFAHQEYNSTKFTDTTEIQKRIDNYSDLFNRDSNNNIRQVEIHNNDYLPPLYNIYLTSFYIPVSETKREKELLHQNMNKNYCFIHSCTFANNGTNKLDYIVDKINSSGLINVLDNVFINNIGVPIENKYNTNCLTNNKYILTNYSDNPLLYENPTINKMKQFAEQNPNAYILYLHTKGNSYESELQNITDWTNMMLYFLVEKYELCISQLDSNYDTVGCNYLELPDIPRHYSGNFWWTKSNYIRTLNLLSEDEPSKMGPEFWLLQNTPNIYNMHSSGINHYDELYPRIKYQYEFQYTFTNTWFEYSEIKHVLLNYIGKSSCNKILEIGSYEGASACFFSDNLLDNEQSFITCVDPFSENDTTSPLNNTTKIHFYNNIRNSKHYNKMLVEEMYSTDFYKKNDKTYNFIYIDGSHLLEDIITDFNNCLQIIEDNGIIWMDDYGAGEITNCIDNLYEKNKHRLQIIHKGYQIAFRAFITKATVFAIS